MLGITSYSVYIPRHRLRREMIAAAWGQAPVPGSKAVRSYDEDSLTMGQAAAWRLLESAGPPKALYFASTTSPHWQRSAASLIAAYCDFPAEVETADFSGSLRCGFSALRAAVNQGDAVVLASDTRDGAPESPEEMLFGDAAAGVRVGSDRVIAEYVASLSRSDVFFDEWRRDVDDYVQSFAGKFSLGRGYQDNVMALARDLLEKAGVQAKEIGRLALVSPDGRSHLGVAKALGIPADRVEDPGINSIGGIGQTGAAMPVLLLAQALDHAKPGDIILALAYGDGADGFLFRATDAMESRSLEPAYQAIEYESYPLYRKLREYWKHAKAGGDLSNVFLKREENQILRLRATRCGACGLLQYPMARVCARCHGSAGLKEEPLARRGHVFTFNEDYLFEGARKPTIIAIVDLVGGGRLPCQMTDIGPSGVQIGMEVELVLRRASAGASMHNYYWKCRPA